MAGQTKKRLSVSVLVLIAVFASFAAVVGVSLAVYFSAGSGTGTVNVAKWSISINDTDITAADAEFDIQFGYKDASDGVVANKVAPGSVLYADFVIDPSGSEVAVDWSFELGEITASSGAVPNGLSITKVCTVADTIETELSETGGKYVGTIALNAGKTALTAANKINVRVYITWENTDSDDANANDTAVGVAAPTLSITVTGTAKQHIAA